MHIYQIVDPTSNKNRIQPEKQLTEEQKLVKWLKVQNINKDKN